jgi:hypothetical protein
LAAIVTTRHAAAFTLLGWYLMTAPFVGPANDRRIDPKVPLSEWHILGPYDSLAECERRRLDFTRSANPSSPEGQSFACVATNDPRIKLGGALRDRGDTPPR